MKNIQEEIHVKIENAFMIRHQVEKEKESRATIGNGFDWASGRYDYICKMYGKMVTMRSNVFRKKGTTGYVDALNELACICDEVISEGTKYKMGM